MTDLNFGIKGSYSYAINAPICSPNDLKMKGPNVGTLYVQNLNGHVIVLYLVCSIFNQWLEYHNKK